MKGGTVFLLVIIDVLFALVAYSHYSLCCEHTRICAGFATGMSRYHLISFNQTDSLSFIL